MGGYSTVGSAGAMGGCMRLHDVAGRLVGLLYSTRLLRKLLTVGHLNEFMVQEMRGKNKQKHYVYVDKECTQSAKIT